MKVTRFLAVLAAAVSVGNHIYATAGSVFVFKHAGVKSQDDASSAALNKASHSCVYSYYNNINFVYYLSPVY